jgi:hypothetical protein
MHAEEQDWMAYIDGEVRAVCTMSVFSAPHPFVSFPNEKHHR